MAALEAALLTKPALDAALAATAVKGSLGINNNKSGIKTLDDPLQDWGDAGGKTKKKKYSQDELDEAMIEMVSKGLSGPEALKVVELIKEMGIGLDEAIYRALYNKKNGKPLLQGITPPPNGDDNNDDDDDEGNLDKPKKDLSKEPNAQDLEDTKKAVERRANEHRSMRNSKAQAKLDSKKYTSEQYGKRIDNVPQDNIKELSPSEKAQVKNQRFDSGVNKAYKEAEELRKYEEELKRIMDQTAPKFE